MWPSVPLKGFIQLFGTDFFKLPAKTRSVGMFMASQTRRNDLDYLGVVRDSVDQIRLNVMCFKLCFLITYQPIIIAM